MLSGYILPGLNESGCEIFVILHVVAVIFQVDVISMFSLSMLLLSMY